MKSNKNNSISKKNGLSQSRAGNQIWDKLVSADSPSSKGGSGARLRPRESQLRAGDAHVATGIDFGHFRQPSSSSGATGSSVWHALLGQVTHGSNFAQIATGGLAGLAEAGFSKLFGGLTNLFHQRQQEPVLEPFKLSQPRNLTITAGPIAQQTAGNQLPTLVPQYPTPASAAIYPHQVTQIVKQALLTSSALNDVIAEI